MTIKKITAGDGYLYLTEQVARGDADTRPDGDPERPPDMDAAAYYAAAGNPPGRWLGRAAPLLGVAGQEVTEDQMRALFGHGAHPDETNITAAYVKAHVRRGMTSRQLDQVRQDAIRAARLGRPFPEYQPLDQFDTRVSRRLAVIASEAGRDPTDTEIKKIKAEESRRQRAAVAGFDLVFSPVKSAALLWAVDQRRHVQDAIRHAHQQAADRALALIEEHAAYTRAGAGGVAQIGTNGLIAAAFEHWDSRAGDPNLHTHVAVSAKVQGSDGKWRSLDARALYAITVAASELYNTAFETALASSLGVTFTPRPGTIGGREPVREITGIPASMITWFSRRRRELEARYAQLTAQYRREHRHDPGRAACHKLAQQACLDTRRGKKPPVSLAAKRARWREELTGKFGPRAVQEVMRAVPGTAVVGYPAVPPDAGKLAERAVAHVTRQRSTWTVHNLRAEAERLLREHGPATLEEHRRLAEQVTARAVALSVSCQAPALLDEPPVLRRDDGEPVFSQHGAARYTSKAVLDAEQRLVRASRGHQTAAAGAGAMLDGYEAVTGTILDAGQRHLVTAFAGDPRRLLAGIGPAGAGKTTAMRALAHILRQQQRRLVPLATSAASAAILARELGVPAENLHKFLHEWTAGPHAARLRSGGTAGFYALRPGDVVLVDEAGMAGTFLLDQLVTIAAGRDAVVRLLGDDRQLSAVESGGALRLIAAQPGTPQLTTLYRFKDPAEAAATLQIRAGDTTAIGWYAGNRRIRSGSRDAMTEAAYAGWKADMLAGKTSLMAAGDGTDVTALAARARTDRVTAGQVETGGVVLRDGNLAGRGDWVVTRDNRRTLAVHDGRDWVKNGDAWQVVRRHQDGSLTCRHLRHGGHVRLPAQYAAAHVELLYAVTAHRAQGTTVDTAHPLITGGMTRETLYVLASRARERTTLYVATHDLLPAGTDDRTDRARTDPRSYAAREILHNILATEGAEQSATGTIRQKQELAGSLAALAPRYLHAAHLLAAPRYRDAALLVFGQDDGAALLADPAWNALVRRLYEAEAAGWQPERLIAAVASARELDTAGSVAEVLCWRIDGYLPGRLPPPHLHQPTAEDAARYAALLTASPAFPDPLPGTPDLTAVPAVLTAQRPSTRPRWDDAHHPQVVSNALGPALARRALAEPAWPAVQAALRRAARAGHDPAAVLAAAASRSEVRNSRTVSELLARRIGRYLAAFPEPHGTTAESWRHIAWMLKAAENYGTSADTITAAVRQSRDARQLIAGLQAAARPHPHGQARTLPPWLTRPATRSGDAHDNGLSRYLDDAAMLITTRIQDLGAAAARDRPAWTRPLGDPPAGPGPRDQWLRHVGVIAAYRDHYQIGGDDPLQVLGPFPEPGHAGHTAYWHAARSVLAARALAGAGRPGPDIDPVTRQVATDLYRALPEPERALIAANVAERLRESGLHTPGQQDDQAVTQAACARHLVVALAEHGHCTRLAPNSRPRPQQQTPVEVLLPTRALTRRAPGRLVPSRPGSALPGTSPHPAGISAEPQPAATPDRRQDGPRAKRPHTPFL